METPWSRVSDWKLPAFKWLHIFQLLLLSFSDEKYETLTVVSGYKVYMKLRIRKVARSDFMQYKCIAKNALGNSDGAITLYRKWWSKKATFQLYLPTFATTEVHPPTTTTTTESTTRILTEKPRRKNRKRNRKRQRERHRDQQMKQEKEQADISEAEGHVIEEVNHISFIINEDKGSKSVTSSVSLFSRQMTANS